MIRDGERMVEILLVVGALAVGGFMNQDDAEQLDDVAASAQVTSKFGVSERRSTNLDEVDSHNSMWVWSSQIIEGVRAVGKELAVDAKHSAKPQSRRC